MSVNLEELLGKSIGDPARERLAQQGIAWSEQWRKKFGNLPLFRATSLEDPHVKDHLVRLRQHMYDLLHLVRKPSLEEKQELFRRKGYMFFPIQSISLRQMMVEDPDYFNLHAHYIVEGRDGKPGLASLRDSTPQAMEASINPRQLTLPDSAEQFVIQLEMITQYSKDVIEKEFPDARAVMLTACGYSQLDKAYKAQAGSPLLSHCRVQALDNVYELMGHGASVNVGRDYYTKETLDIKPVSPYYNPATLVAPAVVFINK